MSDTVLLKARCEAEHEWDVWAEETDTGYRVSVDELTCPDCDPERLAIEVGEPDNLT